MTNGFVPIENCRGCHADELETVMRMDPMPLAGMFCDDAAQASVAPIFPLTWVHCSGCGLIQVLEDISNDALFARYNYASSTVPGLVRHFAGYAALLKERYGAERRINLLEIGCNDGVLLNQLPSSWCLVGCDPSDVAASGCKGKPNYELIPKCFNLATVEAESIREKFDAITGSNCLAHISDLKGTFEAAWSALKPGGDFWIEVHDLAALVRGGQWDTIYHEHKAEWSEASLTRCVSGVGFEHRETLHTPMHGGALRMRFTKVKSPTKVNGSRFAIEEPLIKLRRAYEERYNTPAVRRLKEALRSGRRIAAYGASGRANVYLNQMPDLHFEYIVDEAPLRLNKFLPRVGTPIVAPSYLQAKPVTECLITAWNYRDDIIRKNPQHKGEWLTAFAMD